MTLPTLSQTISKGEVKTIVDDSGDTLVIMNLEDSQGVYITTDLLQLREDTMKLLQKLIGYYKTWSDDWAKRIAEEYENDMVDEENAEEGPESLESPDFGEEGGGETMPQTPTENA